jgi:hypothetical protein
MPNIRRSLPARTPSPFLFSDPAISNRLTTSTFAGFKILPTSPQGEIQ